MAHPPGKPLHPGRVDPLYFPRLNYICSHCHPGFEWPLEWRLITYPEENYERYGVVRRRRHGFDDEEGVRYVFYRYYDCISTSYRYFVAYDGRCLYHSLVESVEERRSQVVLQLTAIQLRSAIHKYRHKVMMSGAPGEETCLAQ